MPRSQWPAFSRPWIYVIGDDGGDGGDSGGDGGDSGSDGGDSGSDGGDSGSDGGDGGDSGDSTDSASDEGSAGGVSSDNGDTTDSASDEANNGDDFGGTTNDYSASYDSQANESLGFGDPDNSITDTVGALGAMSRGENTEESAGIGAGTQGSSGVAGNAGAQDTSSGGLNTVTTDSDPNPGGWTDSDVAAAVAFDARANFMEENKGLSGFLNNLFGGIVGGLAGLAAAPAGPIAGAAAGKVGNVVGQNITGAAVYGANYASVMVDAVSIRGGSSNDNFGSESEGGGGIESRGEGQLFAIDQVQRESFTPYTPPLNNANTNGGIAKGDTQISQPTSSSLNGALEALLIMAAIFGVS
jgi:hypothetical protein